MRVSTPQISYHGQLEGCGGKNDRILSIDYHPHTDLIVTGGADYEIKLWRFSRKVLDKDEECPLQFLTNLTGHTMSINCVRFSPDGKSLASGSDDGIIYIWSLMPDTNAWAHVTEEKHVSKQALRGQRSDVYDLSWAKDSKHIVSGGVDSSVCVWDVEKLTILQHFHDHHHYVQGVAWDPYMHYFITESCDRSCKLYKQKVKKKSKASADSGRSLNEFKLHCDLSKRLYASNPEEKEAAPSHAPTEEKKTTTHSKHSMLMDDSLASFFRRLTFSPDGLLVFVPAGVFKREPKEKVKPTVYVYVRNSWSTPAVHLPGLRNSAVGIKCSPVFYKLVEDSKVDPWVKLSYRIVFAVITVDSVLIYDTQHHHPIAVAEGLHYAQMTDLTWSQDGQTLVVSSSDGYCSILSFQDGELGQQLTPEEAAKVTPLIPGSDNAKESTEPALNVADSKPVLNILQPRQKKPKSPVQPLTKPAPTSQPRRIQPTLIQQMNQPSILPKPAVTSTETEGKPSPPEQEASATKKRRIGPTLVTPFPAPTTSK